MGTPEQEPTSSAGFPAPTGTESRPAAAFGGDAACWLDRVCPGCGGLAAGEPSARCTQCGHDLPGQDVPAGA